MTAMADLLRKDRLWQQEKLRGVPERGAATRQLAPVGEKT